MRKAFAVMAITAFALSLQGCIVLIDGDDDDGETGITVKSLKQYELEQKRREKDDDTD